jgi:hypothetical protein
VNLWVIVDCKNVFFVNEEKTDLNGKRVEGEGEIDRDWRVKESESIAFNEFGTGSS